jgi:ATP phosphoribosyltransferase regulatory subunit
VGGGRYDHLLEHLGAEAPIPAVGCSFWLDRIVGRP